MWKLVPMELWKECQNVSVVPSTARNVSALKFVQFATTRLIFTMDVASTSALLATIQTTTPVQLAVFPSVSPAMVPQIALLAIPLQELLSAMVLV